MRTLPANATPEEWGKYWHDLAQERMAEIDRLRNALANALSRLPDTCEQCGAPEIEAYTPRTVYACGSSDYDKRPGSFNPGQNCTPKGK
jgi:hypothetical protein